MARIYEFKANVIRVLDGDTFDASVDLGFNMSTVQRFRVKDIDCPETWRPRSEAELKHGLQATTLVKSLIEGKEVIVTTYKDPGAYNRYTATVTVPDGRDLKEVLVASGMEKRDSYEEV